MRMGMRIMRMASTASHPFTAHSPPVHRLETGARRKVSGFRTHWKLPFFEERLSSRGACISKNDDFRRLSYRLLMVVNIDCFQPAVG